MITNEAGFGWGGIVTSVVLGIFSAWQTWNAQRKAKVAAVFAQNIETAREVIKASSGSALENSYVEQIKAAQRTAGVKEMAKTIVDAKVDSATAKDAAVNVLSA